MMYARRDLAKNLSKFVSFWLPRFVSWRESWRDLANLSEVLAAEISFLGRESRRDLTENLAEVKSRQPKARQESR